jgi:hypothetical protein
MYIHIAPALCTRLRAHLHYDHDYYLLQASLMPASTKYFPVWSTYVHERICSPC